MSWKIVTRRRRRFVHARPVIDVPADPALYRGLSLPVPGAGRRNESARASPMT